MPVAAPPYDVVHAMLPVPTCDLYHPHAGIAAAALVESYRQHPGFLRRTGARFFDRFNARRRAFAAVERQMLAGPRQPRVLCLSKSIRRSAESWYSLGGERLVNLFNGIDIKRFDPSARPHEGRELRKRLGISGEQLLMLFVGQDFRRKGLRDAILAMADVENPRLRLVVAGKAPAEPYQRLARRKGVREQVIFAGQIGDLYPYYQAADVLVLPTWQDPCSLVVLEALAMGLPVITTEENGAADVMEEGRHGLIVPAGETELLSAAMMVMLDPEVRGRMRSCIRELRPRLALSAHMNELERVYRRVEQRRAKLQPSPPKGV